MLGCGEIQHHGPRQSKAEVSVRVRIQTSAGPKTIILAEMGTDSIEESNTKPANYCGGGTTVSPPWDTKRSDLFPHFSFSPTFLLLLSMEIFHPNSFVSLYLCHNWDPISSIQEKEAKKEAFRKYLESNGVVDAFTKGWFYSPLLCFFSVFLFSFLQFFLCLYFLINFPFSISFGGLNFEVLVALYEQNDKPSSALE